MKAFRINHKMILIWLNYTLPSITVVNSSVGIYSILAVLNPPASHKMQSNKKV